MTTVSIYFSDRYPFISNGGALSPSDLPCAFKKGENKEKRQIIAKILINYKDNIKLTNQWNVIQNKLLGLSL